MPSPDQIFFKRKIFRLPLRSGTLTLGKRTLIMGVLNVTPDSFSDGSHYFSLSKALSRALAIEDQGADIPDIGGESTRPGSAGTSDSEELRRIDAQRSCPHESRRNPHAHARPASHHAKRAIRA